MFRVLTLDPGGTTGYCDSSINDNKVEVSYAQAVFTEHDLWDFLRARSPDYLVYESFQYRPGGMRQKGILRPVELIGVIKLYEQLTDTPTYPSQPKNAVGKDGFFTDTKLKELELYVRGMEHGRVACRHLLHWLTFGFGATIVDRTKLEFQLIK